MSTNRRLTGFLWVHICTLYHSSAKETHKRDDILQKRPIILSILLTVATPYQFMFLWVHICTLYHSHITLYHSRFATQAPFLYRDENRFYVETRTFSTSTCKLSRRYENEYNDWVDRALHNDFVCKVNHFVCNLYRNNDWVDRVLRKDLVCKVKDFVCTL